ncbi:AraC family transcriptional regulator [Flavobacterium sp. LS1R49]|uniref:AraC family transcriptional regulator n=1 Tax=Flavobacterium shii TaxID=2987687 RepID=A0A9X2ZJ52_9FLAO|nr:AraC family transcriptional regulator [Flavobacterium shii]MCV9928553.1 AraC family transcriptional regulator [Flavobacterium shii]
MKTIKHSYGADLDWVAPFAKQLEGKVNGNFIVVPDTLFKGSRYVLDCGDGIVAYYVDVTNNRDVNLIQKNISNDFIGIYYNLSEGEVKYSSSNFKHNVGRWQYNLLVIDSSLETNYFIKAGSKSYVLCIFIKKSMMASYAQKNNITLRDIDKITDPSKNTIIRFDRMSSESFHLIDDLRKLKVGGPVFDLNLTGTVHLLLSNFFKKMSSVRIIIQTVNESDLANIIAIQMFLINTIEDHFPTIKLMAHNANMSESKFKDLFKKITGKTPNTFFIENKLLKAKELLEGKQLTITQVSDRLNFTNNSYFASKFKEHFGIAPKIFVKQL